jgi:ribosomal protein S6--L-glutamate ligase/gamma-F420-2:alpha-L-glutamate ligase
MKGWLIVNNFVKSEKSATLQSMLMASARRCGIDMELKRTGELNIPIGENFKALPDFAVFWDKDIHLAARLESKGLRLFNSSRAIELCDNKVLTYMELEKHGVKFPLTYSSPKAYTTIGSGDMGFAKKACKALGYPCIIKEAYGSFGQQVYLAGDESELEAVITAIGEREFVIQRFVQSSRGRDVRVNVVGGKVVASMYRYNDCDFRSNISNGGSMKAYKATSAQEKLAVDACRALGLDFGGVDVLFDEDGGATVCEVNSNPHFKSTFDCTGVDMSEYIMRYIKETL